MKRAGTVVAVVLVGLLFACGPKKPAAQEQVSAVSYQLSARPGVVPSRESRVLSAGTQLSAFGSQLLPGSLCSRWCPSLHGFAHQTARFVPEDGGLVTKGNFTSLSTRILG
jgi:hypothetical protein